MIFLGREEMLYRIETGSSIRKALGRHQNSVFIAALSIAVLLFYWAIAGLPKNAALTGDELWGATLANLSFLKSVVFVLRFDIHPPLYYMQLNLWALAGHSDLWLQLNSVAWLVATAAIVWHLVGRSGNALAAMIAAAFVLTSPSLVHYAFDVRMYTFLGFLTVLDVLLSETLFETCAASGSPPRRQWLAVLLVHLAICYAYATGAIIVVAHFCYGVLSGRRLQLPRRFYWLWFGLHAAVGVLSLPALLNSMVRKAGQAVIPDASALALSVAEIFAGFNIDQLGSLTFLSFVIFGLALAGFLVASANSRHLLVSYLVLPLLLVFVASHVLRPLWLTRLFLFAVPVVGVVIGRSIDRWLADPPRAVISKARASIVAALTGALVLLQVVISYKSALVPKEPNYSVLVEAFRTQARPGDCITAVSRYVDFWGMARYFAGPDWGDGLQIQAPPEERWATIIPSIPPALAAFLGLIPRSDRFDHDGIHLVSGFPADAADTCREIFAIGRSADFEEMPKEIKDAPIFATSGFATSGFGGGERVTIRGPVNGKALRH
jgi:mannosyltransferase